MTGRLGTSGKTTVRDMTDGAIVKQITLFALPLMLGNIFQMLYNTVDSIVVGNFVGKQALAAVGSTTMIVNMLVFFFNGFSTGAGVIIANLFGARKLEKLHRAIETTMAATFLLSALFTLAGVAAVKPMLRFMATPEDVFGEATVYLQIYIGGISGLLVYNMGSGILRAVGDTMRPLYFLILTSVVNIVLDLLFVVVLDWGIAGVAWATILSQYLSAILVTICLVRSSDCIRLSVRRIRFYGKRLKAIIRVGLPAGLQGALFAISNVLIQSALNSFGSAAVAGSAAAGNIEAFVYFMMNAVHQAAITFCGQNMGAKNYRRIPQILRACLLITFVIYVVGCGSVLLFCEPLLRIYNQDPLVLEFGRRKQEIMMSVYFFCGAMDVITGQLRGMGYSLGPTLVMLTGVCGLRIVWLYTVFARWHEFEVLFLSYPVTWFVTCTALLICFFAARRKLPKGDVRIEPAKP